MGDAFSEFFRQEDRRLVAFVMYLGARQSNAEDVAQTTFLEAYRQWEAIRHPRTWVRTVASRTYFKSLRREGDDLVWCEDSLEEAVVCTDMDLAEFVAQRDRVLAALNQLPPTQRLVMAWTLDGYPPKVIASELMMMYGRPVTPESVRKARQRAREALRALVSSSQGRGLE